MKEAMRIHFEIMKGLNAEQKAKMEELKALMIGLANSWLEDYEKIGRAYGITEDGEEEIYTDGYRGVNNFEVSVFERWPRLRRLAGPVRAFSQRQRVEHV